ncbi:MAG TPA: hypothetical protein VIG88_06900 [Lysobacter sp.]
MRLPLIALPYVLLAAGCASTAAPAASGTTRTVEGRIARIDTAPWAYDGNAVVVLATASGDVRVELPARWNLCRAAPVDVASLQAGDRVRAVGATGETGSITVCSDASHGLRRID